MGHLPTIGHFRHRGCCAKATLRSLIYGKVIVIVTDPPSLMTVIGLLLARGVRFADINHWETCLNDILRHSDIALMTFFVLLKNLGRFPNLLF